MFNALAATLAAAAFASTAPPAALSPEDAFGVWRTENGAAHVQLSPCPTGLCANILWVDRRAPEAEIAGNGFRITRSFRKGPRGWFGGRVYSAAHGRSFSAAVIPQSRNRLKLQGCMFAIFCNDQVWTRIR